jgi:hypothetical protein
LLKKLERDGKEKPGLLICDCCEILHDLRRMQDFDLEKEVEVGLGESEGDGIHELTLGHVRAATAYRALDRGHGFSVQLLRCQGEQELVIQNMETGEDELRGLSEEMTSLEQEMVLKNEIQLRMKRLIISEAACSPTPGINPKK